MPVVRLTAFFRDDDGHGWSETHDKDGGAGVVSLTTFLANFDNLMSTFRRPLLAQDAYYIGCRASYKTAQNTTAGDNLLRDPALGGPKTFNGESLWMPTAPTAIKVRMRNDASTARSDVYLRGGWYQLVIAGVLDFGTTLGQEWKRRADIYLAQLIQPGAYGWVGINPATTSRGKVTGYAANPDGTVTLSVEPTNGVALPAAGTTLSVSFARINDSRSVLNRALVCTVDVGGASVTTRQQVGVGDFESEGTYIAQVKTFIPYAAASYYKASSRKTGRPFGVGRGRSSVRALN